jgi:ribosome-binding protein aMBF1 (putative translation factor)
MTSAGSDRWSEIRTRTLSTPELREQYERTRESVIAIRRMLQVLDAERERAGLSKSELARRIGASPASLRRLFTSPTANPTLRTIVDLFDALGIEMVVRPRRKQRTGEESRTSAGTASRRSRNFARTG